MIIVPENIEANPYTDLHGTTISSDYYRLQSAPYSLFERDGLYASNAISCALGDLKTETNTTADCATISTI